MTYATGRVVHDADAHIMETPTWLRDHADPGLRDRIAPLDLSSGNELRQTGDPAEQQNGGLKATCLAAVRFAEANRAGVGVQGPYQPDNREARRGVIPTDAKAPLHHTKNPIMMANQTTTSASQWTMAPYTRSRWRAGSWRASEAPVTRIQPLTARFPASRTAWTPVSTK